jgi:hypothetical protein
MTPEVEIVKLLKSTDPIDVARGRFYAAGVNGVVQKWVSTEATLNTPPQVILAAFVSNISRLCIAIVKTVSDGASNQARVARFVGDNVRDSVAKHYHVPVGAREALIMSRLCDCIDDLRDAKHAESLEVRLDRASKLVDQARGRGPIESDPARPLPQYVRVVDVDLLRNPLGKDARKEIEGYIEACSFNGEEKSGVALEVVLERLDRLAALV